MPRRPWRSLNFFSASPMRVPLDQSGAAAAARWIARSGLRERSARVSRVSRVAKTNASALGPAARGAGEELQVGARVGLHRARDVAQHHQPPRNDPPAPAREADRVAAGAQAAAQRPPHVDPRGRGGRARAARPAHRGGELQARHQPVELRQLVRLERVEALGGQHLLVAGDRQRHVELGPRSSSPARGAARESVPCWPPGDRGRPAECRRVRALLAGVGAPAAPPNTEQKTASKAMDLRLVGHEHRPGGPVQAPARDRPHQRRAPERTSAGRSGVTGRPASRRRRLNAPPSAGRSSSIVSDPEVSHRCARAARGRPRGSPPGPRRT